MVVEEILVDTGEWTHYYRAVEVLRVRQEVDFEKKALRVTYLPGKGFTFTVEGLELVRQLASRLELVGLATFNETEVDFTCRLHFTEERDEAVQVLEEIDEVLKNHICGKGAGAPSPMDGHHLLPDPPPHHAPLPRRLNRTHAVGGRKNEEERLPT